jgi:hypothetical protein
MGGVYGYMGLFGETMEGKWMTDKMPMNIWVWKPEILYGEFTGSSTPKNPPAEEYAHKASLIEMLEGMKHSQDVIAEAVLDEEYGMLCGHNKAIDEVIKKVREG